MARKKRNSASVQIANAIIATYKPESIAEMNEVIKDVCGLMFEAILNGELKKFQTRKGNHQSSKRLFRQSS